MIDVIKDLSTLTTIPKEKLDKLIEQENWIIVDSLEQSSEPITSLDIGVGTLELINNLDNLEYRFIPSSNLEKMIIEYFQYGKAPLRTKLEETLADRVINVYKDLL